MENRIKSIKILFDSSCEKLEEKVNKFISDGFVKPKSNGKEIEYWDDQHFLIIDIQPFIKDELFFVLIKFDCGLGTIETSKIPK